jgi:hypothetical protein
MKLVIRYSLKYLIMIIIRMRHPKFPVLRFLPHDFDVIAIRVHQHRPQLIEKFNQCVSVFSTKMRVDGVDAHTHVAPFGFTCCLSKASCERQCGCWSAAFTCDTVQMRCCAMQVAIRLA